MGVPTKTHSIKSIPTKTTGDEKLVHLVTREAKSSVGLRKTVSFAKGENMVAAADILLLNHLKKDAALLEKEKDLRQEALEHFKKEADDMGLINTFKLNPALIDYPGK
jgi:hypothetical protein